MIYHYPPVISPSSTINDEPPIDDLIHDLDARMTSTIRKTNGKRIPQRSNSSKAERGLWISEKRQIPSGKLTKLLNITIFNG